MDNKVLFITEKDFNQLIAKLISNVIEKIPPKPPKEFLSYNEAAEMLDIKPNTFAKQVNDGLYPKYISASGKPYVSRKDILDSFN